VGWKNGHWLFVSGGVAILATLTAVFYTTGMASTDPIANPPRPRTIQQSFCSNESFTCRAVKCIDAIGGKVKLPGWSIEVEAGSGKFVPLPTPLFTCKPSSIWKHTCIERPIQCGEYQFFLSSGCGGRPIATYPGYQISCR